jgi:hypothetical protein
MGEVCEGGIWLAPEGGGAGTKAEAVVANTVPMVEHG